MQTTSSLMLSGHSKLEMFLIMIQFCFVVAVFQLLSHVQLFGTSWTAARGLPSPSLSPGVYSNSHPLSQWCHLTMSSSVIPFSSHLQSFPASQSFQMSQLIWWPKYWSFSFSISPSNEHSGLVSFRMDWLDLLAIQDTLKSTLQQHSSKTSILWRSAFFIVQLSHPYMTTGETKAYIDICW